MMKRNSILFSFICLCFTVVNNSFHAQEGFNPLDPLGPSYGKMNRSIHDVSVQDDWVEKMPGTKNINFPDVYYGPTNSGKPKNTAPKNAIEEFEGELNEVKSLPKNQQAQAAGNTWEKHMNRIAAQNQDFNTYSKVQSFDANETNYERFKNSPCFDELGFNPMGDLASLEQAYIECENVKNTNRNLSVLYILGFILLLSAIIFFSLPKEKRLAIIKKLK